MAYRFVIVYRFVFIIFLFLGCSVKHVSLEENKKNIYALSYLLSNLNPKVNKNEAYDLAKSSINYAQKLAQKYEAISSPWIQNTLVNIGIKKRGLCYEWAEDLLKYLVKKNYKTLQFHAIGANIAYLNEHNALAVSAKGEGIKNSIILDAWRNSGNLYFKKIREDKKYEWKERIGLYGVLPPKRW